MLSELMGLIYSNVRLLCHAKAQGLPFDRVATLGRQQVFVRPNEFAALALEFSASHHPASDRVPVDFGVFGEPFFRQWFGAKQVESIDASGYEGATIIHDMNEPIQRELHRQFDLVVDGGTLEHIFNAPIALANAMNMVEMGGAIVVVTNANNHCGHGFYQFSPEFFFRAFVEANGFEVQDVIVVEHPYPAAELSSDQRCYRVTDPDRLRQRVGLVSGRPSQVMTLAKRVNDSNPFTVPPQQSDYVQAWRRSENEDRDASSPTDEAGPARGLRGRLGSLLRRAEGRLPPRLNRWRAGRRLLKQYSLANDDFYERW